MIACADLENVSWSGGVSMDTGVCIGEGGCPIFSNFTEFYYAVYGKF